MRCFVLTVISYLGFGMVALADAPPRETFVQTIEKTPFLKKLGERRYYKIKPKEGPLSALEKELLESLYKGAYDQAYTFKVVRPFDAQKAKLGQILLIGGVRQTKGGKRTFPYTESPYTQGSAALSEKEKRLARMGNFDTQTGEPIPPEEQKALRESLESDYQRALDYVATRPMESTVDADLVALKEAIKQDYQRSLNNFYVVNTDETVDADLITSASNIKEMSHIPDNAFREVYYELIPCEVLLDKNTWAIMRRVTKPGGTIKIATGFSCTRLIPTMVKDTPWEQAVLDQLQQMPNEPDTVLLTLTKPK